MHFSITAAGGYLLIALAVFAHAWVSKLTPTAVANAVGWFVAILTLIVLCMQLIHCG